MKRRKTYPMSEHFTLKLEDLLYAYDQAQGMTRLVVMSQLRHYVQTTDWMVVIDEIKRITNEKHLDVLIGVGMRGPLWIAVISQKAKLVGLG